MTTPDSPTRLGRLTLLWMIPVHVVLLGWVWMGRVLFGVGGWFLLIFLVTLVPVLAIALLLTTVLAYTQPGRPRALTPLQAWAQLGAWAAMFGFGAFCPDFGDTDDSETALLTQLLGRSEAVLDASYAITLGFAAVALAAYVVLLVALIVGRRAVATPA